ncbi:hypothetical protein [Phaeovulum vinaykumarii]|uniref:DUF2157 domain-containing protein n=1 Tax=Phaeovulum vinaykumarii TaxID=407234 RepID=A0A1N7K957_9RHOB|nr:hypothetical protein [Phaeovulum vinaykumarii]SIS58095.1 hypothetical protein SAMN05421795_101723 [Phaeovulum vinaykumarii]SOB93684.1 hypothetical protein SAMN05878426_101719 [Phaeovulum vinaykumarii]
MAELTREDLRAAVAAGILTEAQAASTQALSEARAGQRAAMGPDDEPFEFFRGFAEIFISVGLAILFSGVGVMMTLFTGAGALVTVPGVTAALAWWMGGYFTLKRRMNLPSMLLVGAFAASVFLMGGTLATLFDLPERAVLAAAEIATIAGLWAWFQRFRLPFTMFVLGAVALALTYTLTASAQSIMAIGLNGTGALFDLRANPAFGLATLGFGLAALAAGMRFDMKDPHRLGRHSATAFWLHLLAAPALVNTGAVTFYNMGTGAGMAALAAVLAVMTLLALVIDRRSFLTAGILWVGALVVWVVMGDGSGSTGQWAAILIALGAVLTATGTFWTDLRARLMRALPDFPGKHRLPPYPE